MPGPAPRRRRFPPGCAVLPTSSGRTTGSSHCRSSTVQPPEPYVISRRDKTVLLGGQHNEVLALRMVDAGMRFPYPIPGACLSTEALNRLFLVKSNLFFNEITPK